MRLGEFIQKAQELIESNPDVEDMEVMAEYDYGDRCHTRALIDIEDVEVLDAFSSGYSNSGLALQKEDSYDSEREAETTVVALTQM